MARKQIVVCDRCGKAKRLGTETERYKKLMFGKVDHVGDVWSDLHTEKELCGACVDDVLDVINTPPQ